jgi:hypothetical protein
LAIAKFTSTSRYLTIANADVGVVTYLTIADADVGVVLGKDAVAGVLA